MVTDLQRKVPTNPEAVSEPYLFTESVKYEFKFSYS